MHQWTKCIVVLAWKMAMVGALCPSGFTCSGMASCYLIYPSSNGWEYQDPNGVTHSSVDDVYTSPNCYKYIKTNGTMQSCIDTQRECKKLGGNITVINSIEEYEQLTRNVLRILIPFQDRNFNVHNKQDGISNGCATITIEDQLVLSNNINIVDIDCFRAHLVDAIICESSDVNTTEICPEARTTETAKTEYTSIAFTRPSMENLSRVAVTSIVIVSVAIILLSFLLIRRRQRRKKLGNDTPVVEYQDYVAEDVHRYALRTTVAQNHDTITANEVVYQDVTDNSEYHDTAVDVAYDDTSLAEEVVYHDTSVEVVPVYQNSDVDRKKNKILHK